MSVSKLETLPNEILIHLLEKYVNGVDIFIAFAIELNKRFDALIDQCQQFHFDFESIQKYDFRRCMGVLSDYRDRIESLTLSECDTPGQIHAFLSFFPTFDLFKRLRRLHLNFDSKTVDQDLLSRAIQSLLKANIQTLSIQGRNIKDIDQFDNAFLTVLTSRKVRRLSVIMDNAAYHWRFPNMISSTIEHLTIGGRGCSWDAVITIFKFATRLSYLNARVVLHYYSSFMVYPPLKAYDIQPVTKLQTLILQFIETDPSLQAFEMLVPYLRMSHSLRHLEIIDEHGRFLNGYSWKKLLETSLSLLKYFVLKSGISSIEKYRLLHALTSFQTPFWIERTTFNIYIITYRYVNDDIILEYHAIDSTFYLIDHLESEQRPHSCWTIPQRYVNDNNLLMNNITTLYFQRKSSILPTQYYLNNVKYLTVSYLDSPLLRWITTNINLLNLTKLFIPCLEVETDKINLLLRCAENISSLQIHFTQLFGEDSVPVSQYNSVRRLDISAATHSFKQDDILLLARLFPSIEHLKINTNELENVPLLNIYLSKLSSLTFKLIDPHYLRFGHHSAEEWDYEFRNQTRFLFNRVKNWITIWVDQATFEEPFWQYHLSNQIQFNHETSSKFQKSKNICCSKLICTLI